MISKKLNVLPRQRSKGFSGYIFIVKPSQAVEIPPAFD